MEVSTLSSFVFALIPFLLLLGIFFFFIILPQIKQDKKDKKMREELEIGDEIVTNGGIRGMVVQIKDEYVIIETGGNRTKLSVDKWAIAKLLTEKD